MSYMTTNNARHVQIAKKIARTASIQVKDPAAANYLADGETAVTDAAKTTILTNVTSAVVGLKIQVCQRSGDNIFWSGVLDGSNLRSYLGAAPVALDDQITHIGYDGASATAAIDPINSNDYIVRVIKYDNQSVFANKEMLKFGAYTSDATATQQEVCEGLTTSLVANFAREAEKAIKFEIINSATSVGFTGTTANVDPTNGSKVVAIDGTLTVLFAVGDYIKFAAAGAGGVAGVYKVTAYSAGVSITLDRAFEGTGGTRVVGLVSHLTNAVAAAGNWGIQCVSLPLKFQTGVFKYGVSRFEITLDGTGSTSLTFSQEANPGTGTYEQVAEYEWFSSEGIHGKIERIGVPPPTFKQDAVAGVPYGTLYIEVDDVSGTGTIQGQKPSPVQLYIFMDKTGAAYGTASFVGATSTGVILDAWAAANGGTAQIGNM